ncbi:MAG: hypothetical protein HYY58_04705, partial [Candidatus Omnitrophica bacterium]|nr:hypothetical protein [Candidatus Omnitrophota bacterium]
LSTQLNWGASYLLNDGYKRFLNRRASERHYLLVARCLPFLLALGTLGVAWFNQSIGRAFTLILHLTAGVGPVLLLRWFWWRINPWSEIAAMGASILVLLLRPQMFHWLGWPSSPLLELLFMVIGTALVWLPVTLWTPPVDRGTLQRFYERIQPPGWWLALDRHGQGRAVGIASSGTPSWNAALAQWVIGTFALLATTIGPLEVMVGSARSGWLWCAGGAAAWGVLLVSLRTSRGAVTRQARHED